jgi:hypothetical protein
MAGITSIVELQAKLKAMSPSQVRQVARLGQLHAKLAKKRAAGNASAGNLKVLAKLERTQLGMA